MKNFISIALISLLLMSSVSSLYAVDPVKKRYSLDFSAGAWIRSGSTTTTLHHGALVKADASGAAFTMGLNHWLEEDLAAQLSFSFFGAKAETKATLFSSTVNTNIFMPVLVGVKYYFPPSTLLSSFRTYGSVAVGPLFGFESKIEYLSVGSQTATTAMTRVGAGVDILLRRYAKINLNGSYNLMLDFSTAIGGMKNYSGPEISVGLGILMGKGE